MKDAILLTGASGFIGSNLNKALEDSYRVIQLISPREESYEKDDRHALDLANSEQVDRFLKTLEVKQYMAVIHLAALLCKPGEWDDIRYFDINNAITKNMIRLMNHLEAGCLINFSTLGIYPNKTGIYNEDSAVNMADNTECLYGLAKFNSEMLFGSYLKDRTMLINLRLTQVYGPGMQNDRLIGIMRNELRTKNTITVFGNGERISNFIHISDVIVAIQKILNQPKPGVYNLGHYENFSYGFVARQLKSEMGNESSKIEFREQGIREKTEISVKKFESEFGYQCTVRDFNIDD